MDPIDRSAGAGASPAETLLRLRAADFLMDRKPWFAGRARRKKIAIVRIEVETAGGEAVEVDFARAELLRDGQSHPAEKRDEVVRRLTTFQLDFLFYWLLHLSLVELAIELSIFFAGALWNRSLRKQLAPLLDRQVAFEPGRPLSGLVAFRGSPGAAGGKLRVPCTTPGGGSRWLECPVTDGS